MFWKSSEPEPPRVSLTSISLILKSLSSRFVRKRSLLLVLLLVVLAQLLYVHHTFYADYYNNESDEEEELILFRYDTDYNESGYYFGAATAYSVNAKRSAQRLPQCLIIGARKGGTRALLDALALHPRVAVARREIHFFNRDETYRMGADWYRRQMPFSAVDQLTIEKTPAYFVNHDVPARVKLLNPQMKLILIVREPVTRLISDLTQVHYTRLERNKTELEPESTVFLNSTGTAARQLNRAYKPVRNSLYAIHLRQWLRHFPPQQFFIVDGDRFIEDPLLELRLVEDFLGLPRRITADQLVFNARKGFYCFRRVARRNARCLGATKGRTQIRVDDALRARIARQLRSDTVDFVQLAAGVGLGRNFTHWIFN